MQLQRFRIALGAALLGVVLGMPRCANNPTEGPTMTPFMGPVLRNPSKSGTIAISDNDATVAVVNSEDNSVSFFAALTNVKMATVPTGMAPAAVVIAPDNTTAYVANRADATVVKITGINTAQPTVGTPVQVGSEPTGLALSPSGAKLFVTEFAESHLSIITTSTMLRDDFGGAVRNPRTITVTNNGDLSDTDELVIVPEFYGVPVANKEGQNDCRTGLVHLYRLFDGTEAGSIQLQPYLNADPATYEAVTSPNQLYAAGIANGKLYVPSVSASPAPPQGSRQNVYPVVYVADLATRLSLGGSTINLAESVSALSPVPMPRFFLADLVDVAFAPSTSVAYFVARGADAVQRVDFSQSPPVLGSQLNKQIDIQGSGPSTCQNPSGIAIANTMQKAFVNCWATRRLAVIDLTTQAVSTVVESVTPSGLITAVDRGRRAFFTGRGRWSGNGTALSDASENGSAWSSCGSCHPDGLSDNITWIFGSGPRQTTSMDGTFSHTPGAPSQKQRILNWTSINDELHDFENNTRGTGGGKGAITSSATCGMLSTEGRTAIAAAGLGINAANQTAQEAQNNTANNCGKDFDDLSEYVKSIRPPKGRRFLDPASVMRGAALFGVAQGGCVKCHGGQGWTVSKRFYTPAGATNNAATGSMSLAGTAFTLVGLPYANLASSNLFQISAQSMAADTSVAAPVPPLQLSCSLRKVGTFGVPNSQAATDALEVRTPPFVIGAGPATSSRAQGMGGYNVPSLYGLQLGAPYLHHGQALTLEDLFTDSKWTSHWTAGSGNFLAGASAAQDRKDLINFLLSIDTSTMEQAVRQSPLRRFA